MFDVRRSSVSFPIKLAAVQASGGARMKLQFLFRFDRPFFWPAAGLKRRHLKPNFRNQKGSDFRKSDHLQTL
jgi:hypothetical protein